MLVIRALILSRFDPVDGPTILHCVPSLPSDVLDGLKGISRFMDLIDHEGLFSHAVGDMQTLNYFFTIPSPRARGRLDLCMLSLAFRVLNTEARWIGKIAGFLRSHERTLIELASKIKEGSPGYLVTPAAGEANDLLFNLLLEYYGIVFVDNAGQFLEGDAIGFKIWVAGDPELPAPEALVRFMETSRRSVPRSLGSEFILFMLETLHFVPYACSIPVEESLECPVCARHYLETSAILFVFDAAADPAASGLARALAHVAARGGPVDKPLLLLALGSGPAPGGGDGVTLESIRETAGQLLECFTRVHLARVDERHVATILPPLIWLLGELS